MQSPQIDFGSLISILHLPSAGIIAIHQHARLIKWKSIQPRTFCMPGKHFTNRAIVPFPGFVLHCADLGGYSAQEPRGQRADVPTHTHLQAHSPIFANYPLLCLLKVHLRGFLCISLLEARVLRNSLLNARTDTPFLVHLCFALCPLCFVMVPPTQHPCLTSVFTVEICIFI